MLTGDVSDDAVALVRGAGLVAVDTETSGLDWAADDLNLCQIYTDVTGPLLVTNTGDRPVGLSAILEDPSVVKVFHFAPFDLRFLEAKWAVRTQSVVCTKAASKLLDPGSPSAQHSLQALVERYLGLPLEKGQVRTSDWGSSHLTDEQIAYAAADVMHLPDLFRILQKRLLADPAVAQIYNEVCAYMPVDAHLAVAGYQNPLTY